MSTQVQYRRGTGAQNDSFTGALAEITVNTTDWTLRVHDGTTAGGGQALVGNSATQTLTNKTLGAFTVTGNVTGNLLPSANTTFNLGSNTQAWNSLYVAGNTIYLGALQLKDAGANTFAIYTSDGVTQANIDVGTIDVSSISQGTTAIGIAAANGNAYVTVGGTSNVLVVTSAGTVTTGTASVTGTATVGNVSTAGTISATGNITGNYFQGNGSQLTGIDATSIQSGTSNVRVVSSGGDVTTSVGGTSNVVVVATTGMTVTGVVSVTGTATVGNISTGGTISTTGNITGGNLLINGAIVDSAQLDIQTSASNANIVLTPNGTGNVNIDRMSASGNITAAAFYGPLVGAVTSTTTVSATGNITGGNILGGANVNATTHTGTTVSVTGNITAGNVNATLNGSGANVSSISATNISSGTLTQARLANAAVTLGSTALTLGSTVTTVAGLTSVTSTTFVGALTGAATTAGTVTTAAQGNITSVGTLTGLTVSGVIQPNANATIDLGATAARFNNVYGVTFIGVSNTAKYADLAERYTADAAYEPGTVVEFGGDAEVTISTQDSSRRVAGVVSANPAYLMNSMLDADFTVDLALAGRVPVKVQGPIRKGDMMVSAGNGRARAEEDPKLGSVIGKALENFDGDNGTIEVLILML